MEEIEKVAEKIGLNRSKIDLYGNFIAKINEKSFKNLLNKKNGNLILVSAINPTPAGEGKTTVAIGLLDAFYEIQKKAILTLRQPSMGPVFGLKGGATGGGLAKIIPSNEINLNFTGDFHAVAQANNLLCALVDNYIYQNNSLQINPKTIAIKRCLDVNDRALRNVVIGLGGETDGIIRQEHFTITAASELMAVLCLSNGLNDLKQRIAKILIGFSFEGKPIFVSDLKIEGAIAVVLKNALWPNLVQTLNGSPVLVHGGPFANIAHGCCSIMATTLALKLANYTITEAGFGADLGAEKFFNIKSRVAKLNPNCVVLVLTMRALKFHGGVKLNNLHLKNIQALKLGLNNAKKHLENIKLFGVEVVVAINKFQNDHEIEIEQVVNFFKQHNCACYVCDVFNLGGKGAINLANYIVELCNKKTLNNFKYLYLNQSSLKNKIETVCCKIYGADCVVYSKKAEKKLEHFENLGFGNFPICVCKTPFSLSANKNLIGRPMNFEIEILDAEVFTGAGFVVVYTENALLMPGYGKTPAANFINLNNDKIEGLT